MTLLILYAILAVGVSFLCSMLEAALLSLSRSYIEALVERGSRAGATLRNLKENVDRPLAAILTFNTIAHTVGAAGVGAQAAVVFGSGAVGVASAVMTLLILVFSEIIPKTLGATHAKALAAPTAMVTTVMMYACLPLIVLLERMNRLLGGRREGDLLSRAELIATIRLGRRGRALEQREFRTVLNLLALSSVRVTEILTPRTVVLALPDFITVGEAVKENQPLRYARIPVFGESLDQVTGYVSRVDLLDRYGEADTEVPLSDLSKPIRFIPEQASVADALDLLLREQQHIAVVVDEYGGVAGIVTLEDVIETLLGEEIVDETDQVVDLQDFARRKRAFVPTPPGRPETKPTPEPPRADGR